MTKAFFIAFVMTFFSFFDIPVFWPILLCYWIVLFVLTMRRQIAHMMKYKYIPFSLGKQVSCSRAHELIQFSSRFLVRDTNFLLIACSLDTEIWREERFEQQQLSRRLNILVDDSSIYLIS